MTGRIVVVSGVGSVGKTAVAREVQAQARGVVLHAQMDSFLEMLPAALQDDPQGFSYVAGPEGVEVQAGPVGARLWAVMFDAVRALAGQGDCVLFDAVLRAGDIDQCRRSFAPLSPVFVGLTAHLAVLEAREVARGDRMIGLARAQFDWMHHGVNYDLMVECGAMVPADVARLICKEFDL